MTTFSQMIDELAIELLRPDLKVTMEAYANQTMREMHSRTDTRNGIFFDENRKEVQFMVVDANPCLWSIPVVQRFQGLEAAYCPDVDVYFMTRTPSRAFKVTDVPFAEYYMYRTGPQFAFNGIQAGMNLKLSYFEYVPNLYYKMPANRVVTFSKDLDAYVRTSGGGTPTDSEMASETNWMLQRWDSVIREGVRAKIYKRLSDDSRMRTAYSAYNDGRLSLIQSEPTTEG